MESTRQQKVARLQQKDLADIFLRYAKQQHGVLISVTEVRVSPDLSVSNVYLSIFPPQKAQEIMEDILISAPQIRGELGQKERFQLRIIPELHFHLDTTLDQMEHIDELLGK